MKEKEYIDKFIELCEYEVDYSSKESVKVNNKNAKELICMRGKIENDMDIATQIYKSLLKNNNPKVLTTASSHCLKLGIHQNDAIKILTKISKRKDIGILAFSAEMCLKVYNGEVPGKKL